MTRPAKHPAQHDPAQHDPAGNDQEHTTLPPAADDKQHPKADQTPPPPAAAGSDPRTAPRWSGPNADLGNGRPSEDDDVAGPRDTGGGCNSNT